VTSEERGTVIKMIDNDIVRKLIAHNAELSTYGVFHKSNFVPKNRLHAKLKSLQYRMALRWERYQATRMGRVNLPLLVCMVGTKCTLRCKNCSNLMQFFGRPEQNHIETDFATFKRDLDVLFRGVNNVKHLQIMGGEPLLYKDLIPMLQSVQEYRQVRRFYIITNGTIVPDKTTLLGFQKLGKRFSVIISDYSSNPHLRGALKLDQLKQTLERYKIHYFSKIHFAWCAMGGLDYQKRTQQDNDRLWDTCGKVCTSYTEGKIGNCPRAVNIQFLKNVPGPGVNDADWINLRGKFDNTTDIRRKFSEWFSARHASPCRYCNEFKDRKPVMVAAQGDYDER
jgi:hypothetical protein